MATHTILELIDVRKNYGSVVAVTDISLNLQKGEFLSLLGPSGSGKTTTLSLIAGLTTPSSGDIRIEGHSVASLPPYRRNIGVVFQSYALFPHMSVENNVAFPLEMRRLDKAKISENVRRVLTVTGLENLGERYPSQLSGGQQQRVALARAMVFNPSLLLMDEPLGALDKNLREQMQLEIMTLHREQGISVIYVTHDQGEALAMSDRIAVFKDGRLEQIGTPEDLYDRPRTRFVASFIGETTLLEGRIMEIGEAVCRVDCGQITVPASRNRSVSVGDCVAVSIRPESLRVAPYHSDILNDSLIGAVTNVVYAGGHQKVFVDLRGIRFVAVSDPKGQSGHAYTVGEKVQLNWAPEDAMLVT